MPIALGRHERAAPAPHHLAGPKAANARARLVQVIQVVVVVAVAVAAVVVARVVVPRELR